MPEILNKAADFVAKKPILMVGIIIIFFITTKLLRYKNIADSEHATDDM